MLKKITLLGIAVFSFAVMAASQIMPSPNRAEGDGPYDRLIIRGVILIDGTGAPPIGPVDIVVEKNRITQVQIVGYPGLDINENRRPKADEKTKVMDLEGHYLLPGFVDMHGHIGGNGQGTPAEYVFKLWMAHGITTVRDPSAGNGLNWVLDHKKKSAANQITAPRILAYTAFGQGATSPITNAEQAKAWVNENKAKGADGIKFFGAKPEVMQAAISENKRIGLGSAMHHQQMDVARWNVLHSARAGLTTMEHWYGLPEALFTDRTIQDFRLDYNYQN
nr:amidohydrolase family protein [Algoriphagus sp.]